MKTKKLIITNKFGAIHITNCDSKKDAMIYIRGIEKLGGENNKVVSAIVWDEKTGARDQIMGGCF